MALTSNGVSVTENNEVDSSLSDDKLPMGHEEVEHMSTPLSATTNEVLKTSTPIDSLSTEMVPSTPSNEMNEDNSNNQRRDRSKNRSVSFAPTVQEYEIPSSRYSPFSFARPPVNFVDALVDSYKCEISNNTFPLPEEKKYTPRTNRTRLNPSWREHRIRHLMNKLEELSLWDREEELKATQAQLLRDQKLEQIQDRHRNQDLCLHLMRQRHESELESAVLLDPVATGINDENTRATIARTMNLTSPANTHDYDLPISPQLLKRRVRREQEKKPNYTTPIGRYRQFETKMNNKLDKINQKLRPDWQIMRAYSPIPPTVVPLFSETYIALLSVPDTYSPYKYSQHHHGATSRSHRSPEHAASPDYETRLKSHSNRDVRVPLKEQVNGNKNDDDDDNYNRLRLNASPPRRPTNIIPSTATSLYDCSTLADTPHESSLVHSRPALSNNIHQRDRNDNLDAITQFSLDTSKKILENIRSSPIPTNKHVKFMDDDHNGEENFNYNKSSRMMHQPDIISLSATR